eukprot:TRINITY_DN5718_c0_g2_i1.p1 TRINITY_DN5718_c0_g2~~TRINITY_DN5718_c0_g2_i1.p1  ORF type:complete len:1014 (+),score=165.43 TRINITY_DN5718_c0_g2_i1:338-3379(+)
MFGFDSQRRQPVQGGMNRQGPPRPRTFASEAQRSSSILDSAKISVTRWFADKIKPVEKKKTTQTPEPLSEESFVIIDVNRKTKTKPTYHPPPTTTSTVSFSEESFVIIDDEDQVTPGGPDSVDELVDETNRMNISGSFPFMDAKIYDSVMNAQTTNMTDADEEEHQKHINPIRSRYGPKWKVSYLNELKANLDQIDSTIDTAIEKAKNRSVDLLSAKLNSNEVLDTLPAMWRHTIAKTERQVDELVKLSANLLKECVAIVGLPKEATLVEKVRLKRLMEFCNSVHNRTSQKANALKQLLQEDTDKIIKDIEARELTKIRGRMSECLISELSKINHLAKDLDTSAATIIAALRTDPTNPIVSPTCELHRKRKSRDSGEVSVTDLIQISPVMPQRPTVPRIIKKRRTVMPHFKQRTARLRITESTLLQDICVKSITDNIMDIANLQYRLPDDIMQRIISELVQSHNICDDVIERVVSPFTQTLVLENCIQISDVSCALIGKLCRQLRKLSLKGCINVSTAGIVQLSTSLPYLESLDLSGCDDIESLAIQEILRNCPHLMSLNLSGCVKLTDLALKDVTSYCPNLRFLNIKGCPHFTNGLFEYLGNEIQELVVSDCPNITDRGLRSLFGRSFSIVSIELSGRWVTNDCIEVLTVNCPNLRRVELIGCDALGDQSVCVLSHYCQSLEYLDLSLCRGFSSQVFTNAHTMPQLRKINLSRCFNINDSSIAKLIDLAPALESINASYCQDVTDVGVHALAEKCSNTLRCCDFSGCSSITNDSIMHLAQTCSLESLSLFNCFMISDVSTEEIAKHCRDLIYLDVSCCDVSDQSITTLVDNCRRLEVLALEETKVTNASLILLGKRCHNIHTLKLAYCNDLTDVGLMELAEGCPDIQFLDISYCNKLSLSRLQFCLNRWPKLSALHLRGYNCITDKGIAHPKLSVLNLSWCKNLNDTSLIQIGKGCPSLSEVDLAWCGNISEGAVVSLVKDCVDLRSLTLRGCPFTTTPQKLGASSKLRLYR